MTHSDPIADLLARIKNAYLARHKRVEVPHSKLKEEVVKTMRSEGYLKNYSVDGDKPKRTLLIELAYKNGEPALTRLRRISKPGLRLYSGKKDMPRVLSGLGTAIVTTSKGIMTADKAREQGVGGELICEIW